MACLADKVQLPIVRLLLTKKANVNAVSNTGETALHISARRGKLKTVLCLLEGGVVPLSILRICVYALYPAPSFTDPRDSISYTALKLKQGFVCMGYAQTCLKPMLGVWMQVPMRI